MYQRLQDLLKISRMRLLIDADILVYRCGFATNNEDVAFAKYNMRKQIDRIINATGICKYTAYLSGKDNFRIKRATLVPYKGNRAKTERPIHYGALRDYLVSDFGAVIIDGMEADDALGIEQVKNIVWTADGRIKRNNTIIVSIDKDLDIIPGNHYNFVKELTYVITPIQGLRNFYKQMLTGDASDNIPGLYKYGKVKASNLIDNIETREEMQQIVTREYNNSVVNGKIRLKGVTVELTDKVTIPYILTELSDLLWIKQEESI